MTRFLFERSIQFGTVLVDFGHRVGGPQAANQACRVPRGAAAQRVLLEQDNILPAQLREMIRDARPNNASTNNDDFGLGGQRRGHRSDLKDRADPRRVVVAARFSNPAHSRFRKFFAPEHKLHPSSIFLRRSGPD